MGRNWIQRQFESSRFSASGSMAWTVEAGDVITDAYVMSGTTVVYSIAISSSTTSGTASSELRIALPTSFKVMRTVSALVRLFDTSAVVGYAQVQPDWTYIRITKLDASNFSLATNTVTVQGQIVFELQE